MNWLTNTQVSELERVREELVTARAEGEAVTEELGQSLADLETAQGERDQLELQVNYSTCTCTCSNIVQYSFKFCTCVSLQILV